MVHHHDGTFPRKASEQVPQGDLRSRVESGRRLVEEQHTRTTDEGASCDNALALARCSAAESRPLTSCPARRS